MSDITEREKVLLARMAELPPMTERERHLQRLSFAYGNLACTTNHRPSKRAFRASALANGVPEDVYDEFEARDTWERP